MKYQRSDIFTVGNIVAVIPWLLVYASVIFGHTFLSYLDHYPDTFYVFALLAACCLPVCFAVNSYFGNASTITKIDVLLLGYVAVVLMSNFHHLRIIPNETQENFLLCCLFYLISKATIKNRSQIIISLLGLVLLFLFECSVFLFQLYDVRDFSLASSLLLSGTLVNSGLFAGFVMSLSVFTFFVAKENFNKRNYKWLSVVLVIVMIIIVALTKSRSSFYALIFIFTAIHLKSIKSFYRRVQNKFLLNVGIVLVVFLTSSLLFKTKMNSALGRQLIWKVSLLQFPENTVMGIGYGRFPELYNYWQAKYFKDRNNVPHYEKSNAGLSFVAFNEFLQILIETGALGLSLFLYLNYSAVILKFQNDEKRNLALPFKISLGALLMFALFSYPLHCIPMLFLYFTCLAVISNLSQPIKTVVPGMLIVFGLSLFSGLLIFKMLGRYQAVKEWDLISGTSNAGNNKMTSKRLSVLNEELYIIPIFQLQYGSLLFDQGKYYGAKNILEQNSIRMPGLSTLITLGKSYEYLKEYERAEKSYQMISDMVPNNFESKYLLVNLYMKQKKLGKARKLAAMILKMPVKVPSPAIDQIMFEMKKILE